MTAYARKTSTRNPRNLDPDDEGFSAADDGADMRDQDDAFMLAMRKAIRLGKESVVEGVKRKEDA